jgi:hypothetical protein
MRYEPQGHGEARSATGKRQKAAAQAAVDQVRSCGPSNLVLLCFECHEDAPMTNRPEDMFNFILHREPQVLAENRKVSALIIAHGATEERVSLIVNRPDFQDLIRRAHADAAIGMHFGGRGSHISSGTVASMIMRVIELAEREPLIESGPPGEQLSWC